jgi:hypothetical protein
VVLLAVSGTVSWEKALHLRVHSQGASPPCASWFLPSFELFTLRPASPSTAATSSPVAPPPPRPSVVRQYMTKLSTWAKHRDACTSRSPPGSQIYNDGRLSLWEVEGSNQQVFCQNLCLLSKLFLDHKTLYYDVDPFLFYVLTEYREDPADSLAGGGHQLIGYFSKVRGVFERDERRSKIIAPFTPSHVKHSSPDAPHAIGETITGELQSGVHPHVSSIPAMRLRKVADILLV